MPDLFPTIPAPDIVEASTPATIKYGKSWAFDFEKGQYMSDGAGRVILLNGYDAWKQWCIKTAMTKRYAYLIYSHNYGAEIDDARKQPTRAAVESDTERTITEALLADPRTGSVKNFTFKWNGPDLYVDFIAIPTISDPARIGVIFK
jgi:hypothetical protein